MSDQAYYSSSSDHFHRFKELYDKGGELAVQEIGDKMQVPEEPWAAEIWGAIVALAVVQPVF